MGDEDRHSTDDEGTSGWRHAPSAGLALRWKTGVCLPHPRCHPSPLRRAILPRLSHAPRIGCSKAVCGPLRAPWAAQLALLATPRSLPARTCHLWRLLVGCPRRSATGRRRGCLCGPPYPCRIEDIESSIGRVRHQGSNPRPACMSAHVHADGPFPTSRRAHARSPWSEATISGACSSCSFARARQCPAGGGPGSVRSADDERALMCVCWRLLLGFLSAELRCVRCTFRM